VAQGKALAYHGQGCGFDPLTPQKQNKYKVLGGKPCQLTFLVIKILPQKPNKNIFKQTKAEQLCP
jgi:hypothetical protein